MNKKYGLVYPLIFCIVFVSCSSEKKDEKKADPIEKSDSATVDTEDPSDEISGATNFIVVPGVSFGDILPTSSEKDLIEIFGEENVVRDSIGVGEGFQVFGTKIFKDTEDEITITWLEGAEFEKPYRITVYGSSHWKTDHGIGIGTQLKQLEKMNGRAFTMTGFGWDYAGTIVQWNGGKLEKVAGPDNRNMIIRLGEPADMKISQEEYFQLLGDHVFDSSNDLLQKMNPEVYQMIFILNP